MTSPFRTLLITLAALLVSLAGFLMWYGSISAKSALVAGLQSQIQAKLVTTSRIAAARSALAELAGDEAAVQSYFVSQEGIVPFIDDLESRGRAQGASVTIESVSAVEGASHPTLALTVTVRGTFDAVMRTLGSFEYAPYDLSVTSLSFGLDAKNSWRANVNLSVGSAAGVTPASGTAGTSTPAGAASSGAIKAI